MIFESINEILYSDTLVPDIFITEYLPSMHGNFLKVYIYGCFLSKHGKQSTIEDLSKKLELNIDEVKKAITYLEGVGALKWSDKNIVFTDLKEKEINKIYRLKGASTPEEALLSCERNQKRNSIITAINNSFFQGIMSPSWYTNIDCWFDRFKFDEDVMYTLFQHCYDHKGLAPNYIEKVAENWYSKNIKTSFDVDKYYIEYEKLNDIRRNIIKKLKLSRLLTVYEDEYVEKWCMDYKYSFDIIDLALRRTTGKFNPSFRYIDAIITEWYNCGLRLKEDILIYEGKKKKERANTKDSQNKNTRDKSFEQRKHDDDYFDNLYKNLNQPTANPKG